MKYIVLLTAFCAGLAAAPQVNWNYDKLAARAVNTVDVKLDGAMLRLATKFMSDDEDEVQVKKLVAGLKGIYVKSFEFKNTGEYTEADLAAFRSQLQSPEWERMVNVKSKEDVENVEVYVKMEGNKTAGLAIIAAEPKELTLVNIAGPID